MENIVLFEFEKNHKEFLKAISDKTFIIINNLKPNKQVDSILKKYKVRNFYYYQEEKKITMILGCNTSVSAYYTYDDNMLKYKSFFLRAKDFSLFKNFESGHETFSISKIFFKENENVNLSIQLGTEQQNIRINKDNSCVFSSDFTNLKTKEFDFSVVYKDIYDYLNGKKNSDLKIKEYIEFFNLISDNDRFEILLKEKGFFGINKSIEDFFVNLKCEIPNKNKTKKTIVI